MKAHLLVYIKVAIGFILLNWLISFADYRIDLTADRRYTLSPESVELAKRFSGPVIIDVLLEGELPPEFVKLKTETLQLLNELDAENSAIRVNLVNPLEDEENPEEVLAELQRLGLTPANVTTSENNRVSQELVFPWAVVSYQNKSEKVALLKNRLGATPAQRINNSVQNLEYAFSDAMDKLLQDEKQRIAVITGNGQLEDIYIADLLSGLNSKYAIGKITLDSVASNPRKTLRDLNNFDLALIAKPTEPFTEEEKLVLDQFTVNGGKSLWLLDKVSIELDSLLNDEGKTIAVQRNLNLDDYLFRYGLRVNADLVKDLICSQIVLAAGAGNDSQYNPIPFYYYPMVFARDSHPLTTNLEPVRFQFANSIDTLENAYQKTILFASSPTAHTEGVPKAISLDDLGNAPEKERFTQSNIPMAVLLEGEFTSAFQNRVLPFTLENFTQQGGENKMVVIADGDLVRNQLRNGRPLQLGYDKWTNNFFGNKEFVLNTIDYLLGRDGLINIRNKQIKIPLLNPEALEAGRTKWQVLNIGMPLLMLLIFGLIFQYFRRKRFGG